MAKPHVKIIFMTPFVCAVIPPGAQALLKLEKRDDKENLCRIHCVNKSTTLSECHMRCIVVVVFVVIVTAPSK